MKWGRQRGTEGGRCTARDERFVELTMPSPEKREDLESWSPDGERRREIDLEWRRKASDFIFSLLASAKPGYLDQIISG